MPTKRHFLLGAPAILTFGLATRVANAGGRATVDAHSQINTLLMEYARRLDAGQIEHCAELFAHAEFTIEGLGTVRGKTGVQNLFSDIILYPGGTPLTKHLISNVDIHVAEDGRSATASSYLTVMQRAPDAPLQPIFSGAYSDHFELRDDGWVFTARTISQPLFGDMSRHLSNPPN